MIIAVDLGNTRAKFGFFLLEPSNDPFPEPNSTYVDTPGDFPGLAAWLDTLDNADMPIEWRIARTGGFPWEEFQRKLEKSRPGDSFEILGRRNVPIGADVESQEKVGLDRLLAAFGAIVWWKARHDDDSLLLVADAGSAITVDLATTSSPKPFCGTMGGGAILPGLEATAAALAKISPKLPKIPTENLSFASYPGSGTEEALAAGVFWGAVGAVLHFHRMVQETMDQAGNSDEIPIFLAGGDAEKLYDGLSMYFDPDRLILLPDLVLSAIALTAQYPSVAPPEDS